MIVISRHATLSEEWKAKLINSSYLGGVTVFSDYSVTFSLIVSLSIRKIGTTWGTYYSTNGILSISLLPNSASGNRATLMSYASYNGGQLDGSIVSLVMYLIFTGV